MTISILLVDDNYSFLLALRRLLETLAGVKIVAESHDGYDALTKAELFAPDLMLLDVSMPGLSGTEVARRMQTWDKKPRIVFLSIQNTDEFYDVSLGLNGPEFVEKSDVVSTLIPLIERMVEAAP
jgi:CheY-like chemotaxis protein